MGDTVVKTLKLSLMTSAMLAGCASFSLFAGSGQSGKLNLGAATTNAVTTTSSADGTWSTDPGYVTPVVTGDYFEIDTDTDTVSQFNFSTTSDKKYHECEFDVTVSSVPVTTGTSDLTAPSDVQVGFCVFTNKTNGGAAHYAAYAKAYAKGEWHDLGEVANKAEGDDFKLKVILDCNEATKYAQFLVDGRVLEKDGNSWFALSGTPTVANYVFVGSGSVKAFNRAGFVIESEAVEIPDIGGEGGTVKVDFSPASIDALTTAAGGKANIPTYLKETAGNGQNNLDNYALFGKTGGQISENDTVAVESKAEGKSSDTGIAIACPKLNIPTDMAKYVTFQLVGCATADGKFKAVDGVDSNTTGNFVIPFEKIGSGVGQYKFFKVRATTGYTSANN